LRTDRVQRDRIGQAEVVVRSSVVESGAVDPFGSVVESPADDFDVKLRRPDRTSRLVYGAPDL
jgi:hypothetical protein